MPYYIRKGAPGCAGWSTTDASGKVITCHKSKRDAIQHMVAISINTDEEPGGTWGVKRESIPIRVKEFDKSLYEQTYGDERALIDAMLDVVQKFGKFQSEGSSVNAGYDSPDDNDNLEIGVKCGNCVFHMMTETGIACSAIEQEIEENGACRFAAIPPGLVNTGEDSEDSEGPEELEEADIFTEAKGGYKVPAGVQSAAKRALKWIADGKAGSGFTSVGRRRASQLAAGGSISRDTVARMKSYFARHTVDKKATGFNSGEEGYPSPGRVAWDAWGGTAGQAWVNRINLDK